MGNIKRMACTRMTYLVTNEGTSEQGLTLHQMLSRALCFVNGSKLEMLTYVLNKKAHEIKRDREYKQV